MAQRTSVSSPTESMAEDEVVDVALINESTFDEPPIGLADAPEATLVGGVREAAIERVSAVKHAYHPLDRGVIGRRECVNLPFAVVFEKPSVHARGPAA